MSLSSLMAVSAGLPADPALLTKKNTSKDESSGVSGTVKILGIICFVLCLISILFFIFFGGQSTSGFFLFQIIGGLLQLLR